MERTEKEIRRLKERLAALRGRAVRSGLKTLQAGSIRKVLKQLRDEVRLYRQARSGRVNRDLLEKLLSPRHQKGKPNVGAAIFILRTARGVTQAQLAGKLGTRREAVARWERDEYNQYTLENLQRIFGALGYRLGIRVTAVAG